MEKALRKSQKEERKIAKRKAKEEKELEDVLELSRRETETERGKCASMMLELRSSSVPIPPKLDVLGFVEGTLGIKGAFSPRSCPFTGAMECDPNVEEKDPDIDPSLCFPSDPHSPTLQMLHQNLKILAMIRHSKQTMIRMNILIQA
jgi:hypothetical protein